MYYLYWLIKHFGKRKLFEVWEKHGMYQGADILSKEFTEYVPPYIVQYLFHKFNWRRVVTDMTLPVVRGILKGTIPASYYPHLIVPGAPQTAQENQSVIIT